MGDGAGDAVALTAGGGSVGLALGYRGGVGSSAEDRTAKGWFRGGQDAQLQLPGGQDSGFFSEPPLAGDQTASGLPVRVPRVILSQGTGASGPPDNRGSGPPARPAGASGQPAGNGQGNANGGRALPKRSPEQVRSRLSGFQRGTRRAQVQGGSGGQAPRAGEGTDR
jgi:hypothetical protein